MEGQIKTTTGQINKFFDLNILIYYSHFSSVFCISISDRNFLAQTWFVLSKSTSSVDSFETTDTKNIEYRSDKSPEGKA